MRPTTRHNSNHALLVDLTALQAMLCVGKQSADKIGVDAGAVVRIGNRKVYNVKKIEAYIDSITEDKINE